MISVGLWEVSGGVEGGAGREEGYQTKVQAMGMKARTSHLPAYCSREISGRRLVGVVGVEGWRRTLEGSVDDGGALEGGGRLLDTGGHGGGGLWWWWR